MLKFMKLIVTLYRYDLQDVDLIGLYEFLQLFTPEQFNYCLEVVYKIFETVVRGGSLSLKLDLYDKNNLQII